MSFLDIYPPDGPAEHSMPEWSGDEQTFVRWLLLLLSGQRWGPATHRGRTARHLGELIPAQLTIQGCRKARFVPQIVLIVLENVPWEEEMKKQVRSRWVLWPVAEQETLAHGAETATTVL